MVQPITIYDLVGFLQVVADAFSDPLFLAFTLMLTASVMFHIKKIMVD